MARIKINIPDSAPQFSTVIPIRITDLNYGNHLANDKVLTIAHEARMQFLNAIGFSELNVGNDCGMIMADSAVVYKNEGKYGDFLIIDIFLDAISNSSMEIIYQMKRQSDEKIIAIVKTGIVCFDYHQHKIAAWSDEFLHKLVN